MTYERFKRYVEASYRGRSRYSLVFSERNLRKAYPVYLYAAVNCVARRPAVEQVLGYRYRRLEQFIYDIRVWEAGKWVYELRLAVVNCSYTSRRRRRVEFDVNIVYPWPLDGLATACAPDFFVELALDAAEAVGFPPELVYAMDCRLEPKEQVVGHVYARCWRDLPVEVTITSYVYSAPPGPGGIWSVRYQYEYQHTYPGDVLEPVYERCLGLG